MDKKEKLNQEQSETNEQEIWKSVEGFEDRYECSSLGRVRSLDIEYWVQPVSKRGYYRKKTGKLLKPTEQYEKQSGYTYLRVGLSMGQKQYVQFTLANLIAQHFVPNPNGYHFVVHIDGNRKNNRADNLRWEKYDRKGVEASTAAQSKPVKCIETGTTYASIREAARQTGFSKSSIQFNVNKKPGYGSCHGYHFEYVKD